MCQFSAKHKGMLIREGIQETERKVLLSIITQLLIMRERLMTESNQGAILNDTGQTNVATYRAELLTIMLAFLFASATILLPVLF